MNTDFGNITDRLNTEHERIVAPQSTTCGFKKTDMKPKVLIVTSEFKIPAALYTQAFSPKDRREHTRFHNADPRPPDIEVTVATRFDRKKDERHQSHENKRKRRIGWTAEGN